MVEQMLLKENLVQGGSIWGFSRIAPRKGTRQLNPQGRAGGKYVPTTCNVRDLDMKTVGQLLRPNLDDWLLLFVYVKDGTKFVPRNGSNCAAFVPRKRINIPCGRIVRVK